MAFQIVKRTYNPSTQKDTIRVIMEEDSDKTDLPTDVSVDSRAIATEAGGHEYIFGVSGDWEELRENIYSN